MYANVVKKWLYFEKKCINYQNEGHLDVNFLIYILTIYGEYLMFQFFSRGIRTHIAILTGVQNGRISRQKTIIFCKKMFFLKLISEVKVTCIPVFYFIFSPFTLLAYSFRTLLVAYSCTFPSEQGF